MSALRMRMHPCDTRPGRRSGRSVPWIPMKPPAGQSVKTGERASVPKATGPYSGLAKRSSRLRTMNLPRGVGQRALPDPDRDAQQRAAARRSSVARSRGGRRPGACGVQLVGPERPARHPARRAVRQHGQPDVQPDPPGVVPPPPSTGSGVCVPSGVSRAMRVRTRAPTPTGRVRAATARRSGAQRVSPAPAASARGAGIASAGRVAGSGRGRAARRTAAGASDEPAPRRCRPPRRPPPVLWPRAGHRLIPCTSAAACARSSGARRPRSRSRRTTASISRPGPRRVERAAPPAGSR